VRSVIAELVAGSAKTLETPTSMIWSRTTPRKAAGPPHQGAAQGDALFDEIVRSEPVLDI